jgi:hypothetical protein
MRTHRVVRLGFYRRPTGIGSAHLFALIAAGLLFASPANASGGAASAPSKGEHWSATLSQSLAGCASAKTKDPSFAVATDLGRWKGVSHAMTCPPSRGGRAMLSEAAVSTELEVSLPVHLNRTSAGANASWDLAFNASTFAGTHALGFSCPVSYYNYSFYNSFYNYTYLYRYSSVDCYAIGYVGLTGYAYLVDTTTGVDRFGSSWTGFSNTSGFAIDAYQVAINYSGNASFWPSNSTSSGSFNGSWGSSAFLSERLDPCWWINGSFSGRDHYQIQVYLEFTVLSEVFDVPSAGAGAWLDARSPGEHLSFLGASVT